MQCTALSFPYQAIKLLCGRKEMQYNLFTLQYNYLFINFKLFVKRLLKTQNGVLGISGYTMRN